VNALAIEKAIRSLGSSGKNVLRPIFKEQIQIPSTTLSLGHSNEVNLK
jgi:hypothetical protein